MAHKLEGNWRSFLFNRGKGDPVVVNDDDVVITTINAEGVITVGSHTGKSLSGRVTDLVTQHVLIEHDDTNPEFTRRYEGLLVTENEKRLVIIGKKSSRRKTIVKEGEGRKDSSEAAADAGQDDGTWVLTKP